MWHKKNHNQKPRIVSESWNGKLKMCDVNRGVKSLKMEKTMHLMHRVICNKLQFFPLQNIKKHSLFSRRMIPRFTWTTTTKRIVWQEQQRPEQKWINSASYKTRWCSMLESPHCMLNFEFHCRKDARHNSYLSHSDLLVRYWCHQQLNRGFSDGEYEQPAVIEMEWNRKKKENVGELNFF